MALDNNFTQESQRFLQENNITMNQLYSWFKNKVSHIEDSNRIEQAWQRLKDTIHQAATNTNRSPQNNSNSSNENISENSKILIVGDSLAVGLGNTLSRQYDVINQAIEGSHLIDWTSISVPNDVTNIIMWIGMNDGNPGVNQNQLENWAERYASTASNIMRGFNGIQTVWLGPPLHLRNENWSRIMRVLDQALSQVSSQYDNINYVSMINNSHTNRSSDGVHYSSYNFIANDLSRLYS